MTNEAMTMTNEAVTTTNEAMTTTNEVVKRFPNTESAPRLERSAFFCGWKSNGEK